MAKIVFTEDLSTLLLNAPVDMQLWVYNAFDVLLPHEILEKVEKKMSSNQKLFYLFEMNLCGPATSMMFNGCPTDIGYIFKALTNLKKDKSELENYVNDIAQAVWGENLNVQSHIQMKDLFYFSDSGFGLRPKFTGKGTARRITTDRKALEKIAQENYYARPVVNAILALKDIDTSIEFLERGVEDDGKVRCSFNVTGTESGRWSSSANPWGRGGNFQNQGEDIRYIYLADQGYIFAYPDLAQAEARGVAYLSRDPAYIQAVESGDLHTQVAKLVWPDLDWPGDNGALDRDFAETPFYRHLTYRDLAKRGAHGSNYGGQAYTLSQHLACTQDQAEEFQLRYFSAFSGIKRWQGEIQTKLQSTGKLTTPLGRERVFFGRLDSRETLKEGLAWEPQSLISDILKIGILRLWREYELEKKIVRLHGDMHDGCIFSIKELYLDATVPHIKDLFTIPVQIYDSVLTIPVDFSVGYRWQKKEMREWEPGILQSLVRPEPTDSLLEIEADLIDTQTR